MIPVVLPSPCATDSTSPRRSTRVRELVMPKRIDYKISFVGAVVSLRADTALVEEFARFKKIKLKRNEYEQEK